MWQELQVAASESELQMVLRFLEEALTQCGCGEMLKLRLAIVAEEIFVNIARYAYPSGGGEAIIRYRFDPDRSLFNLQFEDGGIPFDPLQETDPDIGLTAEERTIGGLGIYMVKRTMDRSGYEYRDGKNRLTLEKQIERREDDANQKGKERR